MWYKDRYVTMPRPLTVVQLDDETFIPRGLVDIALNDASRAMWGASCKNRESLERECFTAQRCGQTGIATGRGDDAIDPNSQGVLLMQAHRFAGLVMCSEERGVMFIYNVCVASDQRGKGLAKQLFAWLSSKHRGPFALTVYNPSTSRFRGGGEVFEVASARYEMLIAMYTRLGFRIVGEIDDFVHMRCAALLNLPPRKGRAIGTSVTRRPDVNMFESPRAKGRTTGFSRANLEQTHVVRLRRGLLNTTPQGRRRTYGDST